MIPVLKDGTEPEWPIFLIRINTFKSQKVSYEEPGLAQVPSETWYNAESPVEDPAEI